MGATVTIADFIVNTKTSDFPKDSNQKAIKVIADTFAVILAGVSSEVAEPLQRYLDAAREVGASPILGAGRTTTAETAALINGTYGHALDYDDVLSMMPAHPSVVILSALLAGMNGRTVSGKDFIEAYIIGVEVGGKIGLGITNEHYQRGYHATGTLALFSGLAALSRLYALDAPTIQQAMGIAGSMASGLRRNFGTMTKPLHSGLAARSALSSVRLAMAGFTAAPDIMEAEAGVFTTLGTAASDPDVTARGLGQPFIISNPGIAIKKFPCCYATHRAIDGVLTLRERLGFDAGSIDNVICRMPPGGMKVLTYPRPTTGLEGKFSLPYSIAAAVLDGQFSLWSFSDEAVRRPEITSLYERIDGHETETSRGDDPQFDKRSSGSRGFVEVEIHLKDGRRDQIRVDAPPGAPARELTWDELQEKFMDCAKQAPRIGDAKAASAFAAIKSLDQANDVSHITALLH
ncbi:MAG: MmgE/PrpD family protein [Alphaproteobacteria bacterium]